MYEFDKNSFIQLFVHEQWAGQALQDLFRNTWQAPKKLVHKLRMEKAVAINGQPAPWTAPLKHGDEISIQLPFEDKESIFPYNRTLGILFEDEHYLVVNKPAGMATHPNDNRDRQTLSNGVAYYLQKQGDFRKVRHIHRLDQDTTGAVLFAKNSLSHAVLDAMLMERKIERTYWALVTGQVHKENAVIDQPIGRDRHHPTRRRVSNSGQTAVTHYRVIKKLHAENMTLIECTLDTGRTHQIRVHLSHAGYPLVGDRLYGGLPIFPRQALHARKLAFVHPFTLEKIECVAPFLDTPPIFDIF